MPICHDKQFIFYHIPRCGGTSFESYFKMNSRASLHGVQRMDTRVLTLHHLTGPDLLDTGLIDEATLRSYLKFTVIRDPFDRMASDFYWQKRWDTHDEFKKLNFAAYMDMAEKIIREERYFEKIHYDHFRPMTDYCLHDGKLMVDDILRLECINDELKRLRGRLGVVDLPHLNRVRGYEDLRTPENIARVHEVYACDKLLYENVVLLRDG